jgi:hypothetical protein
MTCREGKAEDKCKGTQEYENMKRWLLRRNEMHRSQAEFKMA